MFRSSGRLAAFAVVAVLISCTIAQAAIIGTATLVKDPANGIAFGTPDQALPAPWVSYALSLASDAGEFIGAVDLQVNGQLHQRWADADEDGVFEPTPNAANLLNGDTHVTAPTGAVFGSGPDEDNSGAGSPLPDTATRDYGVGSLLAGAWGIPGQVTTTNLAYIVIPFGSEPSIQIGVRVADTGGNIVATLDQGDFFGGPPENLPPDVGDLGPLVGDMSLNPPNTPTPVSGTLPASDDGGLTNLTWMFTGNDTFTPDPGREGPAMIFHAPTLNPATGQFDWDVDGSKGGLYTFEIKATDSIGIPANLMDAGIMSVRVIVPEPATLSLFGLALVGLVGLARRRG